MKKLFLVLILSLVSFIFLSSVQNASAQTNIKNSQNVVLAKDQIVNGDYFAAGNTVNIAGTVNGDVFATGGVISIKGIVNGDVLVAGGNINIGGTVMGNVRAAGGNIIETGNVGKNFSAVGGSISLTDSAKIGGNIVGAGGVFAIDGSVNNIQVATGQLSISPTTSVTGKITQNTLPKNSFVSRWKLGKFATDIKPILKGFAVFGKIVSMIIAFVIGWIFIMLFPQKVQRVISITQKDFWRNVSVGLLSIIVVPIVIILLFTTIIGIPVAIIGGMFFGLVLYAAGIVAALVIGKWTIRHVSKKEHLLWSLLAGIIIYKTIGAIPIFGWIFTAIFLTAGLGGIIMEKKQYFTQPPQKIN